MNSLMLRFVIAAAIICTAEFSSAAEVASGAAAEMGGGMSGALGGYGFSVDWSIGSDTSSDGSIGYEMTVSFGKAEGKGFDLSLLDVALGNGTYGKEGGFGAYGTYSIGKSAKFQGKIDADGSISGVISTSPKLPNGKSLNLELEVTRQADGQLQFTPKAGVGISAGDFSFKGGVLTYTIKGTLLSPNDTGAKKVVYDVWTAPGYAVAQTQIFITELLGKDDLKKSDKAFLEQLIKNGINDEGLAAIKKWLELDKEDRVKNMIQVKKEWFTGTTCKAGGSAFDYNPDNDGTGTESSSGKKSNEPVGLTPFKTY